VNAIYAPVSESLSFLEGRSSSSDGENSSSVGKDLAFGVRGGTSMEDENV
jgi:hypothetical protein